MDMDASTNEQAQKENKPMIRNPKTNLPWHPDPHPVLKGRNFAQDIRWPIRRGAWLELPGSAFSLTSDEEVRAF